MSPTQEDIHGLLRSDLDLSSEFVQPTGQIAVVLAEIWRDVLDIDTIGARDDFFEIGGDSLGATIIASNIESRLGCRFSPSQLIDLATIEAQEAHISQQQAGEHLIAPNFTALRQNGKLAPLFVLHGNRGFTLYDQRFLDGMHPDRPLIFVEAIGMDGKEELPKSVPEIAQRYLASVQNMVGDKPWHLAANCGGSLIAIEMCRRAKEAGMITPDPILIDPVSRLFGNSGGGKAKRFRRKVRDAVFPKPLQRRVKWLTNKLGLSRKDPFDQELKQAARMQALIEGRIKRRHAPFPEPLVSSNVSYQAEAMLKTIRQMRELIYEHRPEPWAGRARLIVTTNRSDSLSVIRKILPNADFTIVDCDHKNLFTNNLAELIRFVNSSIEAQKT